MVNIQKNKGECKMFDIFNRLLKPKEAVDVVIDTDTYNEIDDQFALAYLIKKEEKLKLKAIYAAPFHNEKSNGPQDGMIKSYDEIFKVLKLIGREDLNSIVFKGSTEYLKDEKTAVVSDSAKDLAERAMNYTSEKPLYVIAIGAITNIASAILLNPEIIDRIVVVALIGHSIHWNLNDEFNMRQDVAAARVVFGCGVALVQLPCMGVVSNFATTGPELKYWLSGKNKLCDYLVENTIKEANSYNKDGAWSRAIWDVTAVAWLLDDDFMSDSLIPSPIPQYDNHYSFSNHRHMIKYVNHIDRDKLFEDLFKTLSN